MIFPGPSPTGWHACDMGSQPDELEQISQLKIASRIENSFLVIGLSECPPHTLQNLVQLSGPELISMEVSENQGAIPTKSRQYIRMHLVLRVPLHLAPPQSFGIYVCI